MKIIIAPDSFKASMTASEAAVAIQRGVRKVLPDVDIAKIPMADGGEGTVSALVASTKGRFVETTAFDPLGNEITGKYGILGDEKTAVIEMAAVSGLPLVPLEKQNPLNTTTFGTGELIRDALEAGCREFIIGIGGSATNDAGTGMAQALGVKFFRKDGSEITELMRGGLLREVAHIDVSGMHSAIADSHVTVACDVDNPLLGERGCAHVYAPQKGATPEIVKRLDNDMAHFIDIAEDATGSSVRDVPGAGAAGGLGAGLMAFLNAELKPGIELV
ncbi:glycerate kinase, partial [candidate division KSB1 bacterium]|nr:glycerate kinase [candidate division KSB1 bacterium]